MFVGECSHLCYLSDDTCETGMKLVFGHYFEHETHYSINIIFMNVSHQVGTARGGTLSDVFSARLSRYDVNRNSMVSLCLSCTSCNDEPCIGCKGWMGMADSSTNHLLLPGDILIGGVFPVKNKGVSNCVLCVGSFTVGKRSRS